MKPDGTAFDDVGSTQTSDYAWTDLLDAHDAEGIHIDSDTAATRWRGEHMDYGLAIQGLLQLSERPRRADSEAATGLAADAEQDRACQQNVSAETSEGGMAEAEQDPEEDAEWRRHVEEGTFYLYLSGIVE